MSVLVNGAAGAHAQLAPRWIDGVAYGLNMGLVGFGSNNSQGIFDNVSVQVLPPQSQFATTDDL